MQDNSYRFYYIQDPPLIQLDLPVTTCLNHVQMFPISATFCHSDLRSNRYNYPNKDASINTPVSTCPERLKLLNLVRLLHLNLSLFPRLGLPLPPSQFFLLRLLYQVLHIQQTRFSFKSSHLLPLLPCLLNFPVQHIC